MPLKAEASNLRPDELAYIAGIVDGEGCISFCRIRGSHFVRVLVANTNRDVLEYLQSIFGGDIHSVARKPGWKQSWQWRISWSRAIEFLDLIEPWLRIKEDQAHLAFCWAHYAPGRRPNKEKRAEVDAIAAYIAECFTYVNRRGEHNLEDPIRRELCPS